ncbi:CpsD/CapB family tyrosine-protein kinase [Ktedonospora formicarum]|uniref:Polysaccharide biosynthesis tyrosine autokinase n=1 Tax=Ktedonospora formicarum TaxID=2778364 RepID=A0A8J3HY52_9CHLR|nr:CpsD/CapB family tyrosine-protein kinase [Ktedonospora formicarum]GHO43133.1 polysaccharide biosynthesis tyrosine autokinase [Ktedonospora formicarum]
MGLQDQEQFSLLSDYDTNSDYNRAYQALFANIRFALDKQKGSQHVILLAAPTPEREPGLVAANLAIASSQNGVPTLLVDANLSTPSLARRFGLEQDKGLSDLLATGDEDLMSYIQPTFLPELSLLQAGRQTNSAAEISRLLMSRLAEILQAAQAFMARQSPHPSLLILHSPPVLSGIDASLLAEQAEQSYLLITKERTTQAQARQARKLLEQTTTRVRGTILLDV